MKSKRYCKTAIVLVTYHCNEGVIDRVKEIQKYASNCIITIVDNSTQKYKQRYNLRLRLKAIDPGIIYIDHQLNCRFAAYNVGLQATLSDFVVFRTDDDVFDEKHTFKLINEGFEEDFVFTPYYFDNTKKVDRTYQRPLESIIFKKDSLLEFLPFETAPSSDWQLMKKMYTAKSKKEAPLVLLYKKPHGREELAV